MASTDVLPIVPIEVEQCEAIWPLSIEAGRKGSRDKQKLILDKAEGNVPVEDAAFQFPTTPSK